MAIGLTLTKMLLQPAVVRILRLLRSLDFGITWCDHPRRWFAVVPHTTDSPQQLVPSNPTLAGDFRRWMPHLVNSDGGSKSSNIMSHGEPFGCPALSAGVPGDAGTRANGEVVGGHCGVLDPHGQQHHGAGGPLWSRVTALWTGSRPNYSKFTCCFFFSTDFFVRCI